MLLHGGSSRWQHLADLVRELAERWHVYAAVARIDQVGHSLYPWKIAAVLRDFF